MAYDDERTRRMRQETDEILGEFREIAERSKTDPRTRKKFYKFAADWVIMLIDEVRSSRSSIVELMETSERQSETSERLMAASNELKRQIDIVYEGMKHGYSYTELYEKHLRPLLHPEDDDDDDDGPVN